MQARLAPHPLGARHAWRSHAAPEPAGSTNPTDANEPQAREQQDQETNADIQFAISTHRELFTKEYFQQVANLGVQAAEGHCTTPTRKASSTETSSPAICCWTIRRSSGSPTSAWPASKATPA